LFCKVRITKKKRGGRSQKGKPKFGFFKSGEGDLFTLKKIIFTYPPKKND
jgi:hypothetical protein